MTMAISTKQASRAIHTETTSMAMAAGEANNTK